MSGRRVALIGGDGSGAKGPSQLAGPRSSRGSAEGLNTKEVPLRVGIAGTETVVDISSVWRRSELALADEGSNPSAGTPTDERGRDEGDGECTRLRTAGRSSPCFGVAMMASAGV